MKRNSMKREDGESAANQRATAVDLAKIDEQNSVRTAVSYSQESRSQRFVAVSEFEFASNSAKIA